MLGEGFTGSAGSAPPALFDRRRDVRRSEWRAIICAEFATPTSVVASVERTPVMVRERAVQLTPAGKAKLEEELSNLINVKRPELVDRIQQSGDLGDQTDNAQQDGA